MQEVFLPAALQTAILHYCAGYPWNDLRAAYEDLHQAYDACAYAQALPTQKHCAAYVAARLPATYAVATQVLKRLQHLPLTSHLDLGAGPGTFVWAANHIWPPMKTITAVEQNNYMGSFLTSTYPHRINHIAQDLCIEPAIGPHDLVTLGYAYNEIPQADRRKVLSYAWQNTGQALVIVEPGTPAGYQNILQAREILIERGACIFAPCPHNASCPIAQQFSTQWCHFGVRLPRLAWHKHLKAGALGYEDEKYSYLIAVRSASHEGTRIINTPHKQHASLKFHLCSPEGLITRMVTKKDKRYKATKQLKWGDTFLD